MFKNVEKTTTTGMKNYYPCVLMGKANKEVVSPPNFYWSEISWKISSAKNAKVELLVFFHRSEHVDGRAICTLDTISGKVSKFRYQDAKTFTPEDFDNVNSMRILKGKSNDAFRYTISLVHYFGRVNKAEYEKETVLKTSAFKKDEFFEKITDLGNLVKKGSSYNPDRQRVAYVSDTEGTKRPRNYTVESWQRAGHYRHYKSGRVVYIKPAICRPHK